MSIHFAIESTHDFKPSDLIEPKFDPAEFIFTSWSRALTGARPEHKLKIFGEMAKDAGRYAGGHCQVIDDLQVVADKSGLTDLVGDVFVQDAIRAAFGGSVS